MQAVVICVLDFSPDWSKIFVTVFPAEPRKKKMGALRDSKHRDKGLDYVDSPGLELSQESLGVGSLVLKPKLRWGLKRLSILDLSGSLYS